ncbi:hypothetical protein V3481_015082 [Fusarium oxysporum f. sp. vasinfectum]
MSDAGRETPVEMKPLPQAQTRQNFSGLDTPPNQQYLPSPSPPRSQGPPRTFQMATYPSTPRLNHAIAHPALPSNQTNQIRGHI